jgi:hypothetical protein
VTPADVPADSEPVCGRCQRPASWNTETGNWQHAQAADGAWCAIIFPGAQDAPPAPVVTGNIPPLTGLPVDLAADVTVTLPCWTWVNLLGILHACYPPGTIAWVDQVVTATEKAVDQ